MLSLTKEVYQDEASVAPVLVSACAAELVRLRHGGGGGGVGGRSHLTTVAAPFPDCGPGGADVALPLCWSQSWAAGAGALFIIQFSWLGRAFPFAPAGGITNLEMQFHFGVLRY